MKRIYLAFLFLALTASAASAAQIGPATTDVTADDRFRLHRVITQSDTDVMGNGFFDADKFYVTGTEVPIAVISSPGTDTTEIRIAGFISNTDTVPLMSDTYLIDFTTGSEFVATSDTGADCRGTVVIVRSQLNWIKVYATTSEEFVYFYIKD